MTWASKLLAHRSASAMMRSRSNVGNLIVRAVRCRTVRDLAAFTPNLYHHGSFSSRRCLVLDHYPLSSIRSIGLLPGTAFRKAIASLPHLRPRPLSLDDIEHGVLRRELRDPRVHFALVCASRGCPPLRGTEGKHVGRSVRVENRAGGA
jgi:hypothetical protein